jgi:alpha-D-ribose 1-methylphosphonate 5-triphosphate synthase subunit PhnH
MPGRAASPGRGFADPVADAQRTFRAVLEAMASPGRIIEIACADLDAPALSPAAAWITLTLADLDAPIWLSDSRAEAAGWIRFHTGAPIVVEPSASALAFAATGDKLPPLDHFALGMPEFPDRSTTLVLDADGLGTGTRMELSGPGIRDRRELRVDDAAASLIAERCALGELYPRGIDLVLACGRRCLALPRTTRVEF